MSSFYKRSMYVPREHYPRGSSTELKKQRLNSKHDLIKYICFYWFDGFATYEQCMSITPIKSARKSEPICIRLTKGRLENNQEKKWVEMTRSHNSHYRTFVHFQPSAEWVLHVWPTSARGPPHSSPKMAALWGGERQGPYTRAKYADQPPMTLVRVFSIQWSFVLEWHSHWAFGAISKDGSHSLYTNLTMDCH